ncbi:MAG TPA: hypothetical protein VFG50_05090 [Rhodothermales bacterium]|nr:hypothetical protein [Rhodothermales bacterium]
MKRCSGIARCERFAAALLVLGATLVWGCSVDFDPRSEARDLYFSVGGFLNATADTQFVRVMPLRDTLFPEDRQIDAEVSLEDLSTGEVTAWSDSVFTIAGKPVHNFWSATPLAYGRQYRFEVHRSDGAQTVATVSVPDSFPRPELCVGNDSTNQYDPPVIVITGVERVADLSLIYDVRSSADPPTVHTLVATRYSDLVEPLGFTYVARMDVLRDLPRLSTALRVPERDVIVQNVTLQVAAAREDWPDVKLDLETLALPGVVTNVQHGLGYLGAVAVKTVPWPEALTYLSIIGVSVEGDLPPISKPSELCGKLLHN